MFPALTVNKASRLNCFDY